MKRAEIGVTSRTWMRRVLGVLLLAVLAGAVWLLWPGEAAPVSSDSADVPCVLRYEERGMLYTYHIITDTESLFDVNSDPRCLSNIGPSHPDQMERMRGLLAKKMGVTRLEDLTQWHERAIERLRGLGYL